MFFFSGLDYLFFVAVSLSMFDTDHHKCDAGTARTTTASALDIVDVSSVHGLDAVLPCDITPPHQDEAVYLVLWYRGDDGEPLYSYDARQGSFNEGARWSDSGQFGRRAYFHIRTHPAHLSVQDITAHDAGIYRCRVDFRTAPTRNSLVNLTVIVPPLTPTIFDEAGQEVVDIIGQYRVGEGVTLKCISTGGNPKPKVTWWKDNHLHDGSYETTYTEAVQNTVTLRPLTRQDLGTVLSCQASNNNISVPASARVTIDMLFPPIDIAITTVRKPLSAGQTYDFECESAGSRPEPTMTWWLGDVFMGKAKQAEEGGGNITRSIISFNPRPEDDGKKITCRSENTKLQAPDAAIEDTWKIAVQFPPMVNLAFGPNINPEMVDEGNDVYLECNIKANPEVYKVLWRHKDEIVTPKKEDGIIISGESLVLQKVGRNQRGNYTCIASNLEGDSESNIIDLKVMYEPRCAFGSKQVIGVSLFVESNIHCNIDAFPPVESFTWSFNNTRDSRRVRKDEYTFNGTTSTIRYHPKTDHDFGNLYCWAANAKGQMTDPCVIQVIPAGPPESPINCSILNQTTGLMEVQCDPGFDGGLDQVFLMEVFDVKSSHLLANVSSETPFFQITGLNPGRGLRLHVFSANLNGRSKSTTLEGFTLKVAELQIESPVPLEFTPVLGILVGVVVTLLLVALVIILILRLKYRHKPLSSPNVQVKSAIPDEKDAEEYFPISKPEHDPDIISSNGNRDSSRGTYLAVDAAPYPDKTPPYLPTNKNMDPNCRETSRDCEQRETVLGVRQSLRRDSNRNSLVEGGGPRSANRNLRPPSFSKVNNKVSWQPNITVNPNENNEAWTPLLNQLHNQQESTL